MQKLQLYIDDQRVDLFNDETISLTQTIKNVRDVSKVFTDFSRSFTIPASKTNNKIFKHYEDYFIEDGFDAREKISARIEINDVPFRNGKVRLDGVELKRGEPYSYTITFFGNTVALKDLFGEEKLSALTFADSLNRTYNASTVLTNLQLTPINNDILVPLITHSQRLYYNSGETTEQTGNLFNSGIRHGVAWDELKYAIRVHKIIEAIESKYNITFSEDFFTPSNLRYYNLYMWLHRNKGDVTSLNDELYTKLISGWSTSQGGASIMTSSSLLLQGSSFTNLTLRLQRTSTSPYSISITRSGVEVYSQSGIVTTDDTIDLLYAAQSGASYQVTISYSNAITFSNVTWTVGYQGGQDVYTVSNVVADPTFQFIINEQIPEIKVIDFVTGLFKMFNLTAESTDGINITVKDLNTYYNEGQLRDITNYLDTERSAVNASIPYKEISFKYEDTESLLAFNHNNLTGQEWAEESYNSDDNIKEGETFTVEVPFAHFKYERLINPSGGDTSIQWGYSVDSNEDSYVGKPLLFYPILQSHEGILFVNEVSATGTFTNQVSVTSPIVMPSNSLSFDPSVSTDNINFKNERNEYTRTNAFSGTLFQDYYFDYIASIFSSKRRLTKVKAKLPVSFLTNYSLADTLSISDKQYNINSITTDLSNGMSELELLNIVDVNALKPFPTTEAPPAEFTAYGSVLLGSEDTTLYYTVNGGTQETLFTGTLTETCEELATVIDLNQGDVIVIYTDENEAIAGSETSICPESVPAVGTYQFILNAGSNDVGLTVDTSTIITTTTTTSTTTTTTSTTTTTTTTTEPPAPTENIQISGKGVISPDGESNVVYTISTVFPDTTWSVSFDQVDSPAYRTMDVVFETSNVGTGDGSVTLSFGANTSTTLRAGIYLNVDQTNGSSGDSIFIYQEPSGTPTTTTTSTTTTTTQPPQTLKALVQFCGGSSTVGVEFVNLSSLPVGFVVKGNGGALSTLCWQIIDNAYTGFTVESTETSADVYSNCDACESGTTTTTTTQAPFTTVEITGNFASAVEGTTRVYGTVVGGNTVGTVSYSWNVVGGVINGSSTSDTVNVTWTEPGTGSIGVIAIRGGESGVDNRTISILPLYYIFTACDGGESVIDRLGTAPASNQRYANYAVNPIEYYTYSGFTTNSSAGWTIVDLQPVFEGGGITFGCPTSTTTTSTQAYQSVVLLEQSPSYGTGWTTTEYACAGVGGTSVVLVYIDSNDTLTTGTVVYTNTGLSNAYDGNNEWFKEQGTNNILEIAPNGTINTVQACSPTTVAFITGVPAFVIEGETDTYGSEVWSNQTGTPSYSWSVSLGRIIGGSYDGQGNSGITGVSSIDVVWGEFETGTGTIFLQASVNGASDTVSESLAVLPIYYVFDACDGGETVISKFSTEPTLNQRFVDFSVTPEEYYTYNGGIVNSTAGYTVKSLQAVTPTATGCPVTTTTLPPEDLTITGPTSISGSGQNGVVYTIGTVFASTDWVVSQAPLSGFTGIDITFVTSTSGTGDGSVTVNFGSNPSTTETRRSVITVTSATDSASIVISQNPS